MDGLPSLLSILAAQHYDHDGAMVRTVHFLAFPLAKWVIERISRNNLPRVSNPDIM